MQQAQSSTDALVHIAIGTHIDQDNRVQGIRVHERPFIGDLQLDADPDNPALLIAVGEMLGVKQPLSACRLTCLGSLAIVWLSDQHWLVLRLPGEQGSLTTLLQRTFGDDLHLDCNQTGTTLLAHLNPAAINYLLSSENTRIFRKQPEAQITTTDTQAIRIESIESNDAFELLVRKGYANQLWDWLSVS